MIKLKLLTLFLILPFISYGQNDRAEMALYNVGLGSIFSGVGAVINKKPDQKWGKVLLKGMYQGALGGYLVYESKNIVGKISENHQLEFGWYAKIVNSAGTSIIENASSNRDMWEQWHINFGFSRLELYTKENLKLRYKVMPVSLFLTVTAATQTRFDARKSFQVGELIFLTHFKDEGIQGVTSGNIIILNSGEIEIYKVISHEIIHIYQYYDYNFLNTYYNKPSYTLQDKSKIFAKLNRYLYFDLQGPILRGLYELESINQVRYDDNFFEYEARFFSRTLGN